MKRTSIVLLALLAALLIGLTGCSSDPDDTPYIPTVYVAGYYNNGSLDIACYWVDGERKHLDNPGAGNYKAYAITVANGSVYTAGEYDKGGDNWAACYWKDSKKVKDLPGDYTEIQDITVVEVGATHTVYVTGREYEDYTDTYYGCYWEDGVRDFISLAFANVNAVTVAADGTVYAAGDHLKDTDWVAYWWKDGNLQPDLSTDVSRVDYIAVVNQGGSPTVYAAGEDSAGVCSWVDGESTTLQGDGISINAISGSGGKAYVSGTYYDAEHDTYRVCYWENGDLKPLPGNYAWANGIAASGGKAYVSGSYYDSDKDLNIACYWVGGGQPIPLEETIDSYAYGICVK